MKKVKRENLKIQDDDKKFLKEIEILIETDHPNIIRIYEYYQDEVYFYIVTEFVSGGELYDTVVNWNVFNEEKAGYIIYQILSAVNYLHSKNIVHRDIKPENILVEKSEDPNKINIKLIDFGTCNFFEDKKKLSQKVGTPYYIAPEVLNYSYNEKVDVWSCGVILYILLVGYPPFSGNSVNEILESVKKGKYEMTGPEWNKISKNAKDLVKKMLLYDPTKRISAETAIQHDWVVKMYKKNLSNEVDEGYFSRVLKNIKNFNAREKFQQATLAFIVHFLYSSHEIGRLKEVFITLDKNGDGRLTYKELKDGFEKVYGRQLMDTEVANIMEGVDQDNNGYIEYQEFLRAALNKKTLISESNLRVAFEKFDINKDGKLSKNEIIEVLGTSDLEYVNHIINVIDKNNDGEINYQEFCDMMRTMVYNSFGDSIIFDNPKKTIKQLSGKNSSNKQNQKDLVINIVKIENTDNSVNFNNKNDLTDITLENSTNLSKLK